MDCLYIFCQAISIIVFVLFVKTEDDVNKTKASLGPSVPDLDQKSRDHLQVASSEGVRPVDPDRPVHDDDHQNLGLWLAVNVSRAEVDLDPSPLLADHGNVELWPAMQIRESVRPAARVPLVQHHADLWPGHSVKLAGPVPLVQHVSQTSEEQWAEMQSAKKLRQADHHQLVLLEELVPVHAALPRKVLHDAECPVLLVLKKENKDHLDRIALLFKTNDLAKRGK